jgi:quercetin dioxygenase-like cupin family protein
MEGTFADLIALGRSQNDRGAIWTHSSEDLNVNLLRFERGEGVPEHVNAEVDVLLVAIEGEGSIEIDGDALKLKAGQACIIPKGARRSIHSDATAFIYLSCHRRRGGLWPV